MELHDVFIELLSAILTYLFTYCRRDGAEEDVSSYWIILRNSTEHCILKDEASHRTLWRPRFARGYGPVVIQTAE